MAKELRALLEELGAVYGGDEGEMALYAIDAEELGIASIDGSRLQGMAKIQVSDERAFSFTAPPELAAAGTLWVPNVRNLNDLLDAIENAHERVRKGVDSECAQLEEFGFAVIVRNQINAIGRSRIDMVPVEVMLNAAFELCLLSVNQREVAPEFRSLGDADLLHGDEVRSRIAERIAQIEEAGFDSEFEHRTELLDVAELSSQLQEPYDQSFEEHTGTMAPPDLSDAERDSFVNEETEMLMGELDLKNEKTNFEEDESKTAPPSQESVDPTDMGANQNRARVSAFKTSINPLSESRDVAYEPSAEEALSANTPAKNEKAAGLIYDASLDDQAPLASLEHASLGDLDLDSEAQDFSAGPWSKSNPDRHAFKKAAAPLSLQAVNDHEHESIGDDDDDESTRVLDEASAARILQAEKDEHKDENESRDAVDLPELAEANDALYDFDLQDEGTAQKPAFSPDETQVANEGYHDIVDDEGLRLANAKSEEAQTVVAIKSQHFSEELDLAAIAALAAQQSDAAPSPLSSAFESSHIERAPFEESEDAAEIESSNPYDAYPQLADVVGEGIASGMTGAVSLEPDAFFALHDNALEEAAALDREAQTLEEQAAALRKSAQDLRAQFKSFTTESRPAHRDASALNVSVSPMVLDPLGSGLTLNNANAPSSEAEAFVPENIGHGNVRDILGDIDDQEEATALGQNQDVFGTEHNLPMAKSQDVLASPLSSIETQVGPMVNDELRKIIKKIGLVVEDQRARAKLHRYLDEAFDEIIDIDSLDEAKGELAAELDAMVLVRPSKTPDTLGVLPVFVKHRLFVLVVSSDRAFDVPGVDMRIDLGRRASDVSRDIEAALADARRERF